jgi:hypothetical protein
MRSDRKRDHSNQIHSQEKVINGAVNEHVQAMRSFVRSESLSVTFGILTNSIDEGAFYLLPRVSWTEVRAGARCRPTRRRGRTGRSGTEADWPSTEIQHAQQEGRVTTDPRKARQRPHSYSGLSLAFRGTPIFSFLIPLCLSTGAYSILLILSFLNRGAASECSKTATGWQ